MCQPKTKQFFFLKVIRSVYTHLAHVNSNNNFTNPLLQQSPSRFVHLKLLEGSACCPGHSRHYDHAVADSSWNFHHHRQFQQYHCPPGCRFTGRLEPDGHSDIASTGHLQGQCLGIPPPDTSSSN